MLRYQFIEECIDIAACYFHQQYAPVIKVKNILAIGVAPEHESLENASKHYQQHERK
jgi:hypothetical protein